MISSASAAMNVADDGQHCRFRSGRAWTLDGVDTQTSVQGRDWVLLRGDGIRRDLLSLGANTRSCTNLGGGR